MTMPISTREHATDALHSTTMSANTEAFQKLEVRFTAAEAKISTDLEKVNTNLEKLLATEPESEEHLQIITRQKEAEEQQKTALMQCLTLSLAAADGAKQATGHYFKNNKVSEGARTIYGDVGKVPAGSAKHSYEGNSSSGKARVMMGNTDGATFLEFMK
jgi:hypothetical protein